MDGVHDLGGFDGFGPVTPEAQEPVFHAPWEGRVLALSRVLGASGVFNIDQSRFGIERLPPYVYLSSSYYRKWHLRLENLLLEAGFIDADELAAGRALRPGPKLPRGSVSASDVERLLSRGSYARPQRAPARFAIGERVRARNIHPKSHTRLPRYVRGRVGTIERVHGAHVFPDASALGRQDAEWLYTVCFTARELWGDEAEADLCVSVEAFEPYLERI
jgi:nitrile hydratase